MAPIGSNLAKFPLDPLERARQDLVGRLLEAVFLASFAKYIQFRTKWVPPAVLVLLIARMWLPRRGSVTLQKLLPVARAHHAIIIDVVLDAVDLATTGRCLRL